MLGLRVNARRSQLVPPSVLCWGFFRVFSVPTHQKLKVQKLSLISPLSEFWCFWHILKRPCGFGKFCLWISRSFVLFPHPSPEQSLCADCSLCKDDNDYMSERDCALQQSRITDKRETEREVEVLIEEMHSGLTAQDNCPWKHGCCSGNSKDSCWMHQCEPDNECARTEFNYAYTCWRRWDAQFCSHTHLLPLLQSDGLTAISTGGNLKYKSSPHYGKGLASFTASFYRRTITETNKTMNT